MPDVRATVIGRRQRENISAWRSDRPAAVIG